MLSDNFGDRIFWRVTLRIAIPIALQNLLVSSFSLVDTVMLSRLGDIPLSAVGMAGQWGWLFTLVLFGLCSGSAVFVSQYWGARDIAGIKKIYGIALWHTLGVSLLFCAAAALFPEFIVSVFNSDPDVVREGADYLRIAAFSYPAIALTNTFSTVLRSTENVRLPLFATLAATVLNALLNYWLIFGGLGVAPMGVRGAATATVISSWVSPAVILFVSVAHDNIICVRLRELMRVEGALLRIFYRVAAPVIINESFWGLGTLCYNIVFARMDYQYYAAVTIFRTIDGIAFTFFIGLCNACCVMVGKSIGSGKLARAKLDARRFSVVVPLLSLAVGVLIAVFRGPLVVIFNLTGTLSELTASSARVLLLIYGCEYCLRNIPYIQVVGIFRSGGDTATGLKYDLFCVWGLSLPLVLLSAFVLKLPFAAVFLVMLLAEDLVKVVLCIRRFVSMKWIRPVTEQGRAAAELNS